MLSLTSEYALRAIAELAREGSNGGATLARDLAERSDVPVHYLSKILTTLRRAGLLTATRGAKGGYLLARDPADIPLVEVVTLFDGDRVHPQCLFGKGRECTDDDPCDAHDAWKKVKQTYTTFLENQTIASISGLNSSSNHRERQNGRTAKNEDP